MPDRAHIMMIASIWGAALAAPLAPPVGAQQPQDAQDARAVPSAGVPAGTYRFVPDGSDDIERAVDRAVAHMNFLVRPVARSRLRNANRPIDTIEVRYPADSVRITLQPGGPPIVTPRDGSFTGYTRADGEVVRARSVLEPGILTQFFASDDGDKEMVYRLRPDGTLALEVTVLSDRLREPFRYTWVFRR